MTLCSCSTYNLCVLYSNDDHDDNNNNDDDDDDDNSHDIMVITAAELFDRIIFYINFSTAVRTLLFLVPICIYNIIYV